MTAAAHLPADVAPAAARRPWRASKGRRRRSRRARRRCARELASFGACRDSRRRGVARAVARGARRGAVRVARPIARSGASRCAPSDGAGADRRASAQALDLRYFFDWGGGLVWLAVPPARGWRRRGDHPRCALGGGHATLIRAPATRCAPPCPSSSRRRATLAALSARVKESFDPKRHPQSRPHVSRALSDADEFLPRAARRSRSRGGERDPAHLRPLRLLQRDLSDLSRCWATSSTGRAAASISSRTCWRTTAPPSERVVTHIDRCLSCLACMTTCPSGVNYGHLVDQARHRIEETLSPPADGSCAARVPRAPCCRVPLLFRAALCRRGARASRCCGLLPARLRAMLALAPSLPPDRRRRCCARRFSRRKARASIASRCSRVCAQSVLAPRDQRGDDPPADAARLRGGDRRRRRLLRRAHPSHGPRFARLHARRDRCLDARDRWARPRRHRHQRLGLRRRRSRITATCFATSRPMPRKRRASRRWRAMSREFVAGLGLKPVTRRRSCASPITPPARCSMASACCAEPKALLAAAGFTVLDMPEAHICCGSAGTYNMLQPELVRSAARRAS